MEKQNFRHYRKTKELPNWMIKEYKSVVAKKSKCFLVSLETFNSINVYLGKGESYFNLS